MKNSFPCGFVSHDSYTFSYHRKAEKKKLLKGSRLQNNTSVLTLQQVSQKNGRTDFVLSSSHSVPSEIISVWIRLNVSRDFAALLEFILLQLPTKKNPVGFIVRKLKKKKKNPYLFEISQAAAQTSTVPRSSVSHYVDLGLLFPRRFETPNNPPVKFA